MKYSIARRYSGILGKNAVTRMQAILIAAIVVIAGISGSSYYLMTRQTAPTSEVKNQNTIFVESIEEVKILDPITLISWSEPMVCWNIYDSLVTMKGNKAGETKLFPALAENWSISEDAKTYTFTLRRNAKFSNGDPITAQSWVYVFNRYLTTNCPNSMYLLQGILSNSCARAIDDYTLELRADVSFPPLLQVLALGWACVAVNPNVVEANGGYKQDWTNDRIATGHPLEGLYSGPYKVTEFVAGIGGHVTLESNPYYWGNKPKTPKVVIEWDAESSTKILKLKRGDTDFLWRLPTVFIPELLGSEGVAVDNVGLSWDTHFVFFSGRDPLGMDQKGTLVREALCFTFPYENAIKFAYGGFAERGTSVVPRGCPGSFDAFTTTYNLNLTKAAELLDQANCTADPGTGKRLTLSAAYSVGMEEVKQSFTMWQSELAKIGIEFQLREMTPMMAAESMRKGEVDMLSYRWAPDYADAYNFASAMLHSYGVSGIVGSNWSVPQVDNLVDATVTENNSTERISLFVQAQQVTAQNPGIIYVAQLSYTYIHRTWLKGFVYNPIIHIDLSTMYKE